MFPWATFWVAVGSAATVVGVIGGAAVAYFLGGRVNVSVSAEAYLDQAGFVIPARPTVSVVGYRRFTFRDSEVSLTQVIRSQGEITLASQSIRKAVFARPQASGGETLSERVVFSQDDIPIDLIGWVVAFSAFRSLLFNRGQTFMDQDYVLRPR